jgi:hypothetical protein
MVIRAILEAIYLAVFTAVAAVSITVAVAFTRALAAFITAVQCLFLAGRLFLVRPACLVISAPIMA